MPPTSRSAEKSLTIGSRPSKGSPLCSRGSAASGAFPEGGPHGRPRLSRPAARCSAPGPTHRECSCGKPTVASPLVATRARRRGRSLRAPGGQPSRGPMAWTGGWHGRLVGADRHHARSLRRDRTVPRRRARRARRVHLARTRGRGCRAPFRRISRRSASSCRCSTSTLSPARVIEAACAMSWPGRLTIQVLDDSTDNDTRQLVDDVCARARAAGSTVACCAAGNATATRLERWRKAVSAPTPTSWPSSMPTSCRRGTSCCA